MLVTLVDKPNCMSYHTGVEVSKRKSLQEARDKEEPEKHLERISADFIVCSDTIGIHGEKVALVVVDRFSGMTGIYPSSDRSSEEAEAD